MLYVRSVCAWTLLAAFAVGGMAAPAVHRVVHGLEREAAFAAHAVDGHHGGGHGAHVHESCATSAAADAGCALCHAASAGLVVRTVWTGTAPAPREAPGADGDRGERRRVEAHRGRGPPETVA